MAEKVILKTMKCPTCGASLKAKNDTETITCVYCGNSIIPVAQAPATSQKEFSTTTSGILKVEGIKTPSSALAYIDQFFEEYDWESFAYAQTLSVTETNKLADSLKVTSADDKNTWFVCFKSISIPFMHKVSGCKEILASVIAEYKKDNLDAYSKFDAYKRIANIITDQKEEIIIRLEKMIGNAAKYGATSEEITKFKKDIEDIKQAAMVELYKDIESIPEIKLFINEKNAKIVRSLAAKGIQAEEEYLRAKALINQYQYIDALNLLLTLEGYSDTEKLIDKIDRYYLVSDILEIEGALYYFAKANESLNLYPTSEGKVVSKPIIQNIGNIITNYANILYYLDGNNKLKRYNLSTGQEEKLFKKSFKKDALYLYDRNVYLLTKKQSEYDYDLFDLIELNLATGGVRAILNNVHSIDRLEDNHLIFTTKSPDHKTITNVLDVETLAITSLGTKKITIEGFVNDHIVYTIEAPNNYNKNLYIKALGNNQPEQLIEQNIFRFCSIIADKLFYYVGNTHNQTLINVNCDGTHRNEWPLYISDVLFEQGGWLYFVRKVAYNAILCKSRLDGSKFSIIAADIEQFINIKNGYLYYINDEDTLVKVRMDGSNLQELCDDVQEVLSVKEDKIIFVSVDDRITTTSFEHTTTTLVKSIYAVDFSGSGKIKLAYNIKNAKEYDENNIYYIAAMGATSPNDQQKRDMLCKLDVETNQAIKLLELDAQEPTNGCSGFAVAMMFFVLATFVFILGIAEEETGLLVIGLLVGFVSLFSGLSLRKKE